MVQQDLLVSKLIYLVAYGRAFLLASYHNRYALCVLAGGRCSVISDCGDRAF
jgi:hypothetical protein